MRKRDTVLVLAVILAFSVLTGEVRAQRQPSPGVLAAVVGASVAVAEGIHQIVKRSRNRVKYVEYEEPETPDPVLPDEGVAPELAMTPMTNREPEVTNITVAAVTQETVRESDSDPLQLDEQYRTETEKTMLLMEPGYLYEVAKRYYKVGKLEKSREHMFHSLALGQKVKPGRKFLKDKFGLTDGQIDQGIKRYIRSREQ